MRMTQPEPPASAGPDALVTVDLSDSGNAPQGEETGVQTFGRILLGIVLMILGAVLALACGVAWIGAWFWEATFEWADLIGDGLLFIGALFLGLAIFGFELMRRGRKAKVSYLESLSAVPGMEDADDTHAGPVLPPNATGTPDAPPAAKPIL